MHREHAPARPLRCRACALEMGTICMRQALIQIVASECQTACTVITTESMKACVTPYLQGVGSSACAV